MSSAAPERRLIPGPAGDLELLIEVPTAGAPVAVAVCCHPHPLFGGSLTNKVIHTVARAFVTAGAATVRFNFRGVGASVGVHDEGRGECDDLRAVVAWAREHWPGLPLWLGGFSFGAWVALRCHAALTASRLVTVAPPVGRWDFSDVTPPALPWLVVQGAQDELVAAAEVERFARANGAALHWLSIADADHFFHGRLPELRAAVADFLSVTRAGDQTRNE